MADRFVPRVEALGDRLCPSGQGATLEVVCCLGYPKPEPPYPPYALVLTPNHGAVELPTSAAVALCGPMSPGDCE